MKTILNIDLSVLDEYQDYFDANPNSWDIQSYVNVKYNINTAIAFGKFFLPNFIEEKDCIILESRFDKKIFDEWHHIFEGNTPEIEKSCNMYYIKDFFHINSMDYSDIQILVLGNILKAILILNLKSLYPQKEFEVIVSDSFGDKFITFYQVR